MRSIALLTSARARSRLVPLSSSTATVPAPSLAGYDDPRHREIREVFTKAFRAGRIKQLDPFVERTARELVAELAPASECELVRALAVPLPLIVIGQQMGVPKRDIWRIKAWTDAWIQRLHARPAWQKALEKGGPYRFGN